MDSVDEQRGFAHFAIAAHEVALERGLVQEGQVGALFRLGGAGVAVAAPISAENEMPRGIGRPQWKQTPPGSGARPVTPRLPAA